MKKTLTNLKELILRLLFPRTCFHCGADMGAKDINPLCPQCMRGLKPLKDLFCLRCARPLADGGSHCYDCRGGKAAKFKCGFIRSALEFTPQSRSLAHAFKYDKYINLKNFMASLLYGVYKQNPPYFEAEMLVAVPLHKSKLRRRGFNQSELLAEELSKTTGVPYFNALRRIKNTKSQTGLKRAQRLENIKGVFECAAPALIKRKAVILIDDVCTSSATLEECARVLKKAGAREVLALTLLRDAFH